MNAKKTLKSERPDDFIMLTSAMENGNILVKARDIEFSEDQKEHTLIMVKICNSTVSALVKEKALQIREKCIIKQRQIVDWVGENF